MRRRYHLPTDIAVPDGVPAMDRQRLTALVVAAIDRAVRGAAPGQPARPTAGTRPVPRQHVGPASRDNYIIPSYGGDKQVSVPVANQPAVRTPPQQQSDDTPLPAPMPTTNVPYPPARTTTRVTAADTPQLIEYLRLSLRRGPGLAAQVPLLIVDRTVDFWGIEEVRHYAETLARGWRTRLAGQRVVDIAATVRSLAKDFDETMQGSFTRSTFGVPLAQLDERVGSLLAAERGRLEQAAGRRHLTGPELDRAVLDGLLTYRAKLHDQIESHVVQSAWGWMREKREHLDFETLKSPEVRPLYPYEPTNPPGVVEAEVVHAELVRRDRELSQQERDNALAQATRVLRKNQRDPTLVLTEEQATAAISAAEAQKLGRKAVTEAVAAAAIAAEHDDWVNVHEVSDGIPVWGTAWDPQSSNVLRRTAEFVLLLSGSYGKPFTASNYPGHGSLYFVDRGRSVDLSIGAKEPSGFFPPTEAIRFALAIDTAARRLGIEWRVLYDDASVVRAVNEYLGVARMGETANVVRGGRGEIRDINWHGPLVTHFHLDLAY